MKHTIPGVVELLTSTAPDADLLIIHQIYDNPEPGRLVAALLFDAGDSTPDEKAARNYTLSELDTGVLAIPSERTPGRDTLVEPDVVSARDNLIGTISSGILPVVKAAILSLETIERERGRGIGFTCVTFGDSQVSLSGPGTIASMLHPPFEGEITFGGHGHFGGFIIPQELTGKNTFELRIPQGGQDVTIARGQI